MVEVSVNITDVVILPVCYYPGSLLCVSRAPLRGWVVESWVGAMCLHITGEGALAKSPDLEVDFIYLFKLNL